MFTADAVLAVAPVGATANAKDLTNFDADCPKSSFITGIGICVLELGANLTMVAALGPITCSADGFEPIISGSVEKCPWSKDHGKPCTSLAILDRCKPYSTASSPVGFAGVDLRTRELTTGQVDISKVAPIPGGGMPSIVSAVGPVPFGKDATKAGSDVVFYGPSDGKPPSEGRPVSVGCPSGTVMTGLTGQYSTYLGTMLSVGLKCKALDA